MIKTIQDSIDGGEFKPRHTIEIYCPNCSRDVDETDTGLFNVVNLTASANVTAANVIATS